MQPGKVDCVPLEPEDVMLLQNLIARHQVLTEAQGRYILDNWDAFLPHFIKVFPHEYKRVLEKAKDASREARQVVNG
jgi:glutamate synthase domain-containing protein 3